MNSSDKWEHTAEVLTVVGPYLDGGSRALSDALWSLSHYALDVPAVEWAIEDLEPYATNGAYPVTADSLEVLYAAVLRWRIEEARMVAFIAEGEEQFA